MTDNLDFGYENLEYHLVTLLEKLEGIRREKLSSSRGKKVSFQVELRTFEFWKAVISESVASFVYTFLVCGANAASRMGTTSPASVFLLTALTSGFAMMFLTQFFANISGAHVNPAVTIAMGAIKRISFLRTCMFMISQCGGGIAGAAFLYGVTVPGYHSSQENLSSAIGHPSNIFTSWERFGIEFTLTFLVVFSYFMSMDSYRKYVGTSAITIGATYCACSFVFMPHLNPARALGPAFVLNKWEAHWVEWLGPLLGGLTSGLVYEYVFNPSRAKKLKINQEDETSSLPSEDDLNYDDLDKPQVPKFHGSTYNTYRSANGVDTRTNYCASVFSAPPARLERVESIYGGTKSLCRSPPLTRANLNRSQSVYTKSNTAINRELLPKPGPLVPAQSLYPMRLNQQSHIQNQNMQNQLQQRTDQVYGIRGVTPGTTSNSTYNSASERPSRESNYSTNERQRRENYVPGGEPLYGARNNLPSSSDSSENNPPPQRNRRPESVYAMLGSQNRNVQQQQHKQPTNGQYPESRTVVGSSTQNRPPPPQNGQGTGTNSNNYHHQHSPNPQY
ncbi:neurogenic protein big brain [Euwallacea fornicatus]|uniref:neurogenic protein big brain n=1 Tax=Euwallacea fornicatus TaxID=995702 RepID=UPI00338EFCB2